MTAHAMNGDREKCLEAGMNDYVAKPVDPEKLFSALVRWIQPGKREIPQHLLAETGEELHENEILPMSVLPGISVKNGLNSVGGNQMLYRMLLGKFGRNYAATADDIRAALEKDDLKTATRLTHTIKGLAGNIGAQDLHLAAVHLESALRKNQTERMGPRLDAFSEALDRVVVSIEALERKEQVAAKIGSSEQTAAKSMNRDRVFSLLSELRQLLKEDDTRAVRTLEKLRKALPADMPGDELADLQKLIERYSFEDALETLCVIVQKLDGKGKKDV